MSQKAIVHKIITGSTSSGLCADQMSKERQFDFGDIVCLKDSFRGDGVYIMTVDGLANFTDEHGWFYVPKAISAKFVDPVEYYSSARYHDHVRPSIILDKTHFELMTARYKLDKQKIIPDTETVYKYEPDEEGSHFEYGFQPDDWQDL